MNCRVFSTNLDADDTHNAEIFREQIRDLYSSVPLTTGLAFSGASIMAFLLWSLVNPEEQVGVLIWMGLFALLAFVRLLNFLVYTRHESQLEAKDEQLEPQLWARLEVMLTAIYGVLFGGFFLLFYDTNSYNLFYQMQMATFLFCMILASASFLSSHLPSYIALALGSGVLVIIRLIAEADWVHISMIPVVLVFNIFVYNFVERLNRKFKESLQARFQNLDLIQALVEKKEQAEQANIDKSKFIAAAGHDLRQPLHAISICSSSLAHNLGNKVDNDEGRRLLATIDKSVAALDGMFNTLSYISKFDSGDIISEMLHFSLADVHDQIALEFSKMAEEKGLVFIVKDSPFYTYSDPELYGVILRNLISNAIQFTRVGGVYVSAKRYNDYLEVEISDTGVGVSKEVQERFFDEEYQLSNPGRDRTNGLGLGLALVKRLTKMLGLELTLRSSAEDGTCISLRLPVGCEALNAYPRKKVLSLGVSGASIDGLRVLVIDDDETALVSMESLLGQWGCLVVGATSKSGALKMLEQKQVVPDVIIADYRLKHNATGIEAIRCVREHYENLTLPALMVTADRGVDFRSQGLHEEDHVLYKPVKPAVLLAFLKQIVDFSDKSAVLEKNVSVESNTILYSVD